MVYATGNVNLLHFGSIIAPQVPTWYADNGFITLEILTQ
jgi:hypothetical protein